MMITMTENNENITVSLYIHDYKRTGYELAALGTVYIEGLKGNVMRTASYFARPKHEGLTLVDNGNRETVENPEYIMEYFTIKYNDTIVHGGGDTRNNADVVDMSQKEFVAHCNKIQDKDNDWQNVYQKAIKEGKNNE